MPVHKPEPRQPHGAAKKGVTILSKSGTQDGVKTLSKYEGESDPKTEATSRVVGHEEFDKTKKLTEDKDMDG
jgi:hypothetical protein